LKRARVSAEPSRPRAQGSLKELALRLGLASTLAGCVPGTFAVPPEIPPSPLRQPDGQALPRPETLSGTIIVADPNAVTRATERGAPITLSAVDSDVRAILPLLAEAADLSLVMGPEVQGRVTMELVDVPALDAIALVLEAVGLSVVPTPLRSPWPPVVFYNLPISIDIADRELIRERFGVSVELAQWLVDNRLR
jgi:hypothetical protein